MLDTRGGEEDPKAESEVQTAVAGGGQPPVRADSKVILGRTDMDGQQVVQQTAQQQQQAHQQQQQNQQQPQQLIVSTAGLHQQIQMQQQQQAGAGATAQETSGQAQQTVASGGQQVVTATSQGQQQQVSMEVQQQTVASSPQQVQQQTLLVNTANIQQQMQVPQQVGISTPQSPMCSANNTISTMQAQGVYVHDVQACKRSITQPVGANTPAPQLQQVQVLQQPVQNAYVQQLYNAQGQMLMSSNIALHPGPANINPAGSIQVITAGKPFQSNQINAHVLGKPVLTAGTQQTSFPSYATIPTTTNQTLVIGSLISSQPNILPAHSASAQQQKQEIQKAQQVKSGQASTNSVQSSLALSGCVVSQSPTMLHHLISPIQYTTCQNRSINNNGQVQLSPWQFNTQQLPLWTSPHHPQVINAQTPIFIRGPHQDQPMFIQSPPPQQSIQQQTQSVGVASKPELKGQTTPQVSRTLSILPSITTPIRPATSTVTTAQIIQKQPNKLRSKIMTKSIPIQKLDAQNQTKPQPISPQQHIQTQSTKMIITSQGTLMPQQLQTIGQASQTTAQQIQAAQANLQAAQQQLQQQIIQPKPPPLMSITMSTPGVQVHSPKDVTQIQGSDEKTLMETQQTMISQDPTSQVVTVSLAQDNSGLMKLESPMLCNATQAEVQQPPPPPTPACQPVVQQSTITPSATSTLAQPGVPVQSQQTLLPPTTQQTVVLSGTGNSQPVMNTISSQQQPTPTQQQGHTPQEIRITVLGPVDEASQSLVQPQAVAPTQVTQPQPQVQLPSLHQPPQPAAQQPPTSLPSSVPFQTPPIEEEVKSSGPPKAMVKPQVLTHVIEGYVIHESSEPFPINRGSLLTEMAKTVKSKTTIKDNSTTLDADEPPLKKTNVETPTSAAAAGRGPTGAAVKRTKCESCAGDDKNKKKRFCNVSCLNRANGVSGKKKGTAEEKISEKNLENPLTPYNKKDWEISADTNDSATSGGMESASSDAGENNSTSAAMTAEQAELENLPKTNPVKWTVSDVCDFIRNLPGCCDYVEDFAIQEIDGQALLLLKEDHLMSAMSMKLGPALKICARIDTLRSIAEGGNQQQQPGGQTVNQSQSATEK